MNIFSGGGRKGVREDGNCLTKTLIRGQFFTGVETHTQGEVRDGLMKDPEINFGKTSGICQAKEVTQTQLKLTECRLL